MRINSIAINNVLGARLEFRRVTSLAQVRLFRCAPLLFALALAVACGPAPDTDTEPGLIDLSLEPSELLPDSVALQDLGQLTYDKECVACHGADGDGLGEAAYLLYPRPRDFTTGRFRLIST